ncbi:hypothetical protein [Chryseobacterium sp. JM1]|uniref:hypothetical protein n=1 Tax=Chryseobacterium sp. JM1 TaxID=1233950 RepID=UPI0004E76D91|nr:hypothetical protein [Chryseobacterium sp. JM1]KFF21275.1 hypothetical protein IW22_09800 [Chryseobacterium sp. JM1]
MNQNLITFRNALENYLNSETPEITSHVQGLQRIDLSRIPDPYSFIMADIPVKRANKMRENLKNHRELCDFHYSFHLKKSSIDFIVKQFGNEVKLVWDIIQMPQNNPTDPKITFALGKENSNERFLVLDVDTPISITGEFPQYQKNFNDFVAPIFDRCFTKNGFAKTNTRTVYVKNDASFKKLCDAAMHENHEMYLETCIISLDIIDLVTGASPYNFFNIGQFSFFEKVVDQSGAMILSNFEVRDESLYGDVNPTRPPY